MSSRIEALIGSQAWWCTSIIPATQESENQPGQHSKSLSTKQTEKKKVLLGTKSIIVA
jgi:hypothetical protein